MPRTSVPIPPPKTPLGAKLVFVALGILLGALLINLGVSYGNLKRVAENNRLVLRADEILGELEKTLSTIKDAETGQRGYLLTEDEAYLAPYHAAVGQVQTRLETLKGLVADSPSQRERVAMLQPKVAAKLAELDATVQLARQQNRAAAIEVVKTDRGKKQMDEIRDVVGQIEQEERALLDRLSLQSDRSLTESLLTLLLGSLGVVTLLVATAVGVRQYLGYRQQTEARIRAERNWLEVTLGSIGDAVLATDNEGRVVFINPIAESLTGWTGEQARGKPLDEVFRIINELTRQQVESPVTKVLREGMVVGLANHTVLLARNGAETPIDDSAAPIFDDVGNVFGVVLVFRDATAQRQAQEALETLAAIVKYSDDAIISKTIDGIITSWNAAAERLLGYTAEEAIGQSISIIVPTDRREELGVIMHKLRGGERVDHFDTVRRRKDGTLFNASLQISPIRNSYGEITGASKVLRDITERKRSEDSLALLARASRALATLMDRKSALQQAAGITVPFFADWCVVYCLDHEGNIEQQACAHLLPEMERKLRDMLEKYPIDWNAPAVAVRVLRSGKTEYIADVPETLLLSMARTEEERQALRELHPLSLISVPLLVRERVIGAMTFVASDPSRRYQPSDVALAEELAGRVAVAIDNAQLFNSVKQADRQKDEFLAMLAHELRNPLAAIKYATVLAQMPSAEPKAELFEIIDRQVKNLAHLIDDLLDISRISQDKIQLKREFVDAATLAKRAAGDVAALIEEKKHSFTIDIAKQAMPLHADPTRIEQIITNLLTNAAKYTPDGGAVTLSVYPDSGSVVIKVKDTGVGIPAEMLPRVFDLFTQLDKSLDRSEGGLGIGLTVVRRLVEKHGGSVAAASPGLGGGAEFTVRLPLTELKPYSSERGGDIAPRAHVRLKILIVDDNRDTAHSAALLLRAAGHDVREAHDGISAVHVAREFRPRVVLLDIGLPGMNGYEVAEALRREPIDKIALIAVSGYGQADDRKRSLEAGFDHHLVKPVDYDALNSFLSGIAPAADGAV